MFDTDGVKAKMNASVEHFKEELKKVRTGRAHPDMLANVRAEVYDQMTPLNQIANVTIQGASMLLITPYDVANIAKISSAIRADQSLGLNPSDDGRVIRVPVPPLTEERRRELAKQCKAEAENAKMAIRNARREAIEEFKKLVKKGLPEDVEKDAEEDMQKTHDKYIKKVDELYAAKEKEIMTV